MTMLLVELVMRINNDLMQRLVSRYSTAWGSEPPTSQPSKSAAEVTIQVLQYFIGGFITKRQYRGLFSELVCSEL